MKALLFLTIILTILLSSCQINLNQDQINDLFINSLSQKNANYDVTYYIEQKQSVGNRTSLISAQVRDSVLVNYSVDSTLISPSQTISTSPQMIEEYKKKYEGMDTSSWDHCSLVRTFYESGDIISKEEYSCLAESPSFMTDAFLKNTMLDAIEKANINGETYYIYSLTEEENQQCYVYYFDHSSNGIFCFATETSLVSGVIKRLDLRNPEYTQLKGFTLDRDLREKGWAMIEAVWTQ